MMYPRLFLAWNLLKDDGVIFVSIDDNEVHNLRLVMNEIFGEENFIGEFIWKRRAPYVRQIFEEYATGLYSMVTIRQMVTNAGLKTKKGNKVSVSHIENILKNPFYYGYMDYKGMLYKHVHPRLITKELFDECQRVRLGRRKISYKQTKNPYVLRGLLKCIHCGCSYSPELKKKKYIYMRPTKSQGDCLVCHHMNEPKILSQIEEVLKSMSYPKRYSLRHPRRAKKMF